MTCVFHIRKEQKIPAWKENGLIKHSPLKKMTGKFKA